MGRAGSRLTLSTDHGTMELTILPGHFIEAGVVGSQASLRGRNATCGNGA